MKADNLSLSFPTASSVEAVTELIGRLRPNAVHPIHNPDAMDNLKFSECLSPDIAAEVFTARFDDRAGVEQAIRDHTV